MKTANTKPAVQDIFPDIKPQHTQGEWKTATQPFGDRNNCVQTVSGKTLAICQHDTKGIVSEGEAEANAQRIVKAVNMHDGLVSLLNHAKDILVKGENSIYEKEPLLDDICRLLKQAEQK